MIDPRRLLWQQVMEYGWVFDGDLKLRYRSHGFPEDPRVVLGTGWQRQVQGILSGRFAFVREVVSRRDGTHYSLTHFPLFAADGSVCLAGGTAQTIHPPAPGIFQDPDAASLAKFVHDEIGPNLSAAGLQLELMRMDWGSALPGLAERTDSIQTMLETVMDSLRKLGKDWGADGVDRSGLPMALERLASRVRERFHGEVLVDAAGTEIRPETAAALYRIARQAVENGIRKAGCSGVQILLKSTGYGPALEVRTREKAEADPASAASLRRDPGLLLLEQSAARSNLNLSVVLERNKGMLVKAVSLAKRPQG